MQVRVLPLSEKFLDYGNEVTRKLQTAGVRVEMDDSNEKLGAKIRNAQLEKVPYMLVLGEKESQTGTVTVRKRTGGDQASIPVEEFLALVDGQIKTRALAL